MLDIVLCTYNGARFLRDQLDSLCEQSLQANEIIACDDCSTDDTVAILTEYSGKLPLKIFVNKVNLGYARNFSQAVSLCCGSYIALCDQDDVWTKDKIQKLKAEMLNMERDNGENVPLLVYSDRRLIDESGKIVAESSAKKTGLHYQEDNFMQTLFFGNPATGCSMLLNRALVNAAGAIPVGLKSHDWWYILVAAATGKIGYIEQQLLDYRLHGHNAEGLGIAKSWSNIRKQLSWAHNDSYLAYKIVQASVLQNKLWELNISHPVVDEFCNVLKNTHGSNSKRFTRWVAGGFMPQGFLRKLLLAYTVWRGNYRCFLQNYDRSLTNVNDQ